MEKQIDPSHEQKRSILRVVGPIVLVIGLIFLIVALVDFFSCFGSFREPKRFWCAFVGMPSLWLGAVLTSSGFAGSVQRYFAQEAAPVAKDTINYVAVGTRESVKTVATAIGEGFAAGTKVAAHPAASVCPECNQANDADARFCKGCGTPIAKIRSCANCGKVSDSTAEFCSDCGTKLNKD